MKRNRKNSPEFQKVLLFLGVLLLLLVGSFFIGMYLGTDTASDNPAGGPVVVDDAVLNRGTPADSRPETPEIDRPAERAGGPTAETAVAPTPPKKIAVPPTGKKTPRSPAVEPAPHRVYAVQVGAFRQKAPADKLAARLAAKGYSSYVVGEESHGKGYFYKVRIGRYEAKRPADRMARKIRSAEGIQTFVAYR